MDRRLFLRNLGLAALFPAGVFGAGHREERGGRALLLSCPLAGFQYHQAPGLWPQLVPGQRFDLVREPGNPHDPRAVSVRWKHHMLGYLPRDVNEMPALLLDQGSPLHATLAAKREGPDPWSRILLHLWTEA